jgi:hypothetical protein
MFTSGLSIPAPSPTTPSFCKPKVVPKKELKVQEKASEPSKTTREWNMIEIAIEDDENLSEPAKSFVKPKRKENDNDA